MKYIKTYEILTEFERLKDELDHATSDEEKQVILLKVLDFVHNTFETDFEVGDYIKYKEKDKHLGQEFSEDFFKVTDIDGNDRPKKYRDKIQQGHAINLRTGGEDYIHFQYFQRCLPEEIAQLKYNL
jgi:hypothetical protein